MATTKFTVIRKYKKDNTILMSELASEWTYKTAEAIAKEATKEEYELIAVVESKKMFPMKGGNNEQKIKDEILR